MLKTIFSVFNSPVWNGKALGMSIRAPQHSTNLSLGL
jgi:hypothetical protein